MQEDDYKKSLQNELNTAIIASGLEDIAEENHLNRKQRRDYYKREKKRFNQENKIRRGKRRSYK